MRPLKPVITLAEAVAWAREYYGLEAEASVLPGEIDRNVLLTTADGPHGVLKLAPACADRLEIECQLAGSRRCPAVTGGVEKLQPNRHLETSD